MDPKTPQTPSSSVPSSQSTSQPAPSQAQTTPAAVQPTPAASTPPQASTPSAPTSSNVASPVQSTKTMQESVSVAQQSAQSGQPDGVPKKKSFKKFLFVLVLLILIVGSVAGGYYLANTKKVKSISVNLNEDQGQAPQIGVTPTPDPTENWQLFTSLQNTFSLKAPATFTKNPKGVGDIIILEQQQDVTTHTSITPLMDISARYVSTDGNTLELCATNDDCYSQVLAVAKGAYTSSNGKNQYQEVIATISGQMVKGVQMLTPAINTFNGTNTLAQVNYFFDISHNKKRFEFQFTINGDMATASAQKQTVDTILSTFKFIDQQSVIVDTSSWKTYTDGLSFSLKYPDTWKGKSDAGAISLYDPNSMQSRHSNGGGSILVPQEYIDITINNNAQTAKAYVDSLFSQVPYSTDTTAVNSRKSIVFNGITAETFLQSGEGANGYDIVVSDGKNHIIILSIPTAYPSDDAILSKILASLTFLN